MVTKKKGTVPVPERTDTFFMQNVLQTALNARVGIVLMTVVVLSLVFVIFHLISRPLRTIVIDGSTGQTYSPISAQYGTAQELVDRQLVFYSVQVCENYFNFDYKTIEKARQSVFELGNKSFRNKLGEDYLVADKGEIKNCMTRQAQSFIQWDMKPRITLKNDPRYTVYAALQRMIKDDGLVKEVKNFNIKIEWGRLNNDVDYTKRPHALVLLDIQILEEGSVELNEQINKIK